MIRRFFRLLSQLISLAFIAFVLTAAYIVYDGLNDKGGPADCAVVLGHAVKADGQPGLILRERLDRAVQVYRDRKAPLIIVSGGQHLDAPDEAAAMAKYLEAHQVPAEVIVEDHKGDNTADTARNVAAIMRARKLRSVMIVSHYYHITRTKMALQHAGIIQVSQVHVGTATRADIYTIAREVVALYYYLVKDYVEPAAAKAVVQAADEAQKLKGQIQSEADKTKDSEPADAK